MAATQYLFPTSAELREIEQDLLPVLTEEDPIFELMPLEDEDADVILWEQMDTYYGLQQVRGINGEPPSVVAVDINRYRMEPGYYGEFMEVDEAELTRRRIVGSFNQPIKIEDLVRQRQEQLLDRELKRIKYIGWTLLATGTFSVSLKDGAVAHTDTYPLQTFTSTVSWSTASTATPLADFRAVQLKARGHSVSFGADATAFMTQVTWNQMISNQNSADLYGRRTAGLATYENVEQVNKLFQGDNLPAIRIYEGGYLDNSRVWHPFIPDGTVIVVGQRPNKRPVGNYTLTRNVNNPDGEPGMFTTVVDSLATGTPVPRRIQVFKGHNGGPKIYFPSAVVVMTVN